MNIGYKQLDDINGIVTGKRVTGTRVRGNGNKKAALIEVSLDNEQ